MKITQKLSKTKTAPKRRPSSAGYAAPAEPHVCCLCGHRWQSVDVETRRVVILATKVNRQGPHCNLCWHLEMATRYALARRWESLSDAVKTFTILKAEQHNR